MSESVTLVDLGPGDDTPAGVAAEGTTVQLQFLAPRPCYTFSPQADITPLEAAWCAAVLAIMTGPSGPFTDAVESVAASCPGVRRHFTRYT